MATEIDTVTQRPRTPNDQYTNLTNEQIKNIKKDVSPFFHTISRESAAASRNPPPREGGRHYKDRFSSSTSEHLVRGNGTQPFGWIDSEWCRNPQEEYNSCRGRASVRWGPNKAGERTRSHFYGETIDRYTNIDMYRRNPTNTPGRVVMDHGRPADGYYSQKYPSRTTFFGSSVPLNQTEILNTIHSKTQGQYDTIKRAEQSARLMRADSWPAYTEYTDQYLLHGSSTLPPIPSGTSVPQEVTHEA